MVAGAIPVHVALTAAWVGSDGLYESLGGAVWAVLVAHGIKG